MAMKIFAITALVLSLSAPSYAQDGKTTCVSRKDATGAVITDCGPSTTPKSTGNKLLDTFLYGTDGAKDAQADSEAIRFQKTKTTVAQLLADGNCEEAKRVALKAGYIDLAKDVVAICGK